MIDVGVSGCGANGYIYIVEETCTLLRATYLQRELSNQQRMVESTNVSDKSVYLFFFFFSGQK